MTDAKLPEEAAEKEQKLPPSVPALETEAKAEAVTRAESGPSTQAAGEAVSGDVRLPAEPAGAEEGDDEEKADRAEEEDGKPKAEAKSLAIPWATPTKKQEEDGSPLLHKGNPLRWARGGATAGLGTLFGYLLMAHNSQLSFGVPLGIVCMAIAAWGFMDLLGTFDDAAGTVHAETTLRSLFWPVGQTAGALVLYLLSLAQAVAGRGPQWLWSGVITIAFLGLVAAVFDLGVKLGPWAKDELGLARPLWKREGFWVIVVATLLFLPMLGSYSLWDPWETHYGEVSREILARDDWISLWWAQDGWFWSKPILDFWIQAIFMAVLGVHYKADQMLMGSDGPNGHPEWAVRTPVFLLVIIAMYLLYKGVAKAFGRRAGLFGSIVLATMSDWYFLAHQTMTDMPFVAAMTAAMGLLLLGLFSPEEAPVKTYEVNAGTIRFRISGWHLVFGAILISALPQIIYLFSRNLELVLHGNGPFGFNVHWDEFKSGSAGNCGSPGNEACTPTSPAGIPAGSLKPAGSLLMSVVFGLWHAGGGFEPFVQAIVWSVCLGVLLYLNWGERRIRRLYYLAAWYFAAVATMGKGPAGFGLPMLCAFAYVCTTKRWKELLRFELLSGILIILCVALPWYVAMYVRHGSPFTDRLIFHDMFNRAFHHVHDTNEGDDTSFRFYIWQLGYALFPWTGLVPLGLVWWMRRPDGFAGVATSGSGTKNTDAAIMLLMWFAFSFALFSFMGTKFHHYIFPAVPPAAMLLGVTLDEMVGERRLLPKQSSLIYLGGILASVALTVAGVARFWPGSIFGEKGEHSDPAPPSYAIGAALVVLGLGLLAVCIAMFGRSGDAAEGGAASAEPPPSNEGGNPYRGDPEKHAERAVALREDERRRGHEQLMLSGAALAGALLLALVGRDLSFKPDNADQPGAIRLLHLFTYNYRRAWPDSLDFNAILTGFTIVGALLGLALSVRAIRRHIIAAFFALGVVWAVWGLDVYMIQTAPHWGQREIMQAYYAHRSGPEEPLIAYQMNWKGENFYTGNHIPAFVSSGATFTSWLKTQKDKGVKVMFFVTEHGRINGLKGELDSALGKDDKRMHEVTDKTLNNKFAIIRATL